jgi:5-(carboxyamino)imidazole ribonucleotide synthase
VIVGVIGGGQLGRMLALAGFPLGLRFIFLDPAADACAGSLGEHLRAPYDDPDALQHIARLADVVTFEFENVPSDAVEFLAARLPAYPPALALAVAQDRLVEKSVFREIGIPTPPYAPVESEADLHAAVARIGLPAVLKTRRLGYDGKGQAVLRDADDLTPAWQRLGGVPLILERFVAFDREVSMVAVRGRNGETAFYPLVENVHRDGILRVSCSRPDDAMQGIAEDHAGRILDRLGYIGVLAFEFFQAGDELLANEIAPRVHNSGHWTIEGAEVSQFENHLRAILGLPLGATGAVGHAAMVNFIGDMPPAPEVLALPHTHLHDYAKQPKPGRKVGHATIAAPTAAAVDAGLARLAALADTAGG